MSIAERTSTTERTSTKRTYDGVAVNTCPGSIRYTAVEPWMRYDADLIMERAFMLLRAMLSAEEGAINVDDYLTTIGREREPKLQPAHWESVWVDCVMWAVASFNSVLAMVDHMLESRIRIEKRNPTIDYFCLNQGTFSLFEKAPDTDIFKVRSLATYDGGRVKSTIELDFNNGTSLLDLIKMQCDPTEFSDMHAVFPKEVLQIVYDYVNPRGCKCCCDDAVGARLVAATVPDHVRALLIPDDAVRHIIAERLARCVQQHTHMELYSQADNLPTPPIDTSRLVQLLGLDEARVTSPMLRFRRQDYKPYAKIMCAEDRLTTRGNQLVVVRLGAR